MSRTSAHAISIGTDCSGMDTPIMALRALNVPYKHMFSCDNNKGVKRHILENFPPEVFYDDLMTRNSSSVLTPAVDVYVAGFPCQPFSSGGLKKGFKDKRGKVFYGCADYIQRKRPKAFILENVSSLIGHDKNKTFLHILRCLNSIGRGAYDVQWQKLNTSDHGVPQNRVRVYIVGLRKDCLRVPFSFPETLPKVSIESSLDRKTEKPNLDDAPGASRSTSHRNVKICMKSMQAQGLEPLKKTYLIDADSTPKFLTIRHDEVMCMTKGRGSGHWISNRGRRMNLNEMLRCQGMTKCFKQVVTDRALGGQVGNAMSQNVLERLFVRILPAAGLVSKGKLSDRWVRIAQRGKRRVEARKVKSPFSGIKKSKSIYAQAAARCRRLASARL